MLNSVPIRRKLAVALAAPLVIANAVSFFGAYQSYRSANRVGAEAKLATASLGPGALITGLRLESSVSAVVTIGLPPSVLKVGDLPTVRRQVDQEVAALGPFVRSHGRPTEVAYQPVFTAVSHIAGYRAQLDGFTGPRTFSSPAAIALGTSIVQNYDAIIQSILDADTQLIGGISDPVLRNGAELLDANARTGQVSGALTTALGGLAESGKPITPTQQASIAEQYGELQALMARVSELATGVYANAGPRSQAPFLQTVRNVIAGQKVNVGQIVSSALGGGSSDPANTATTNAAATLVTNRAKDLQNGAKRQEEIYGLLALLSLIIAYASTRIASRSITGPLHDLRSQAEDLAANRLPATVEHIRATPLGEDVVPPELVPVTSRSRDEIGELASALNSVQKSAVDLAVEQAVLRRNIAESFVNLGRRNQNLIGRQLDAITGLEREETDPDVLASLFRLDHNATRMRRNAESLLVLAGIEPARRWIQPVALADVVRASLAEVEDYQRVNLRQIKGLMVLGPAATDLAHLMAELIENGLVFSSPDTSVEVLGRAVPDGYAVSIVDEGIGMSDEERARANARLAGTEGFMVAPSRYLGHYVSGHLADRLGVTVTLHEGPTGGTVARLILPMAILTPEQASLPAAGDSGASERPPWDLAPRSAAPASAAPAVTIGAPAPWSIPSPLEHAGLFSAAGGRDIPIPVGAMPSLDHPDDAWSAPAVTRSGLSRRVRSSDPSENEASIPRAAVSTADGIPDGRPDPYEFLKGFRDAATQESQEAHEAHQAQDAQEETTR